MVLTRDVEKMDIRAGVTAAIVGINIHFPTLDRAECVGLPGRQRAERSNSGEISSDSTERQRH
jgi:hypothetical protein